MEMIKDLEKTKDIPSWATVKIVSKDKDANELIIEALKKAAFLCETTSPKMYNDKTDLFFQYVAVSKKDA